MAISIEPTENLIPANKITTIFIEAGEYNGSKDEYQLETMADLHVASDGSVWARIADSVDEIPEVVS